MLSNRSHSLHILRNLVRATCLRRTKLLPRLSSALKLPRKTELIETVELTLDERELYDFFKRRSYLLANGTSNKASAVTPKKGVKMRKRQIIGSTANLSDTKPRRSAGNIIVLISVLRMICNHGEALLSHIALEAWRSRDTESLSWESMQAAALAQYSCCICGQGNSREEDEKREADMVEFSCNKHRACETCATPTEDAVLVCPKCSTTAMPPLTDSSARVPSSKVAALLRNLLCTLKSQDASSHSYQPIKRYVHSKVP